MWTWTGFDLDDVLDQPPIDWRISQLEQHYGRDAVLEAEERTAHHVTLTQHWESSQAAIEALLCGTLEQWRGPDSPQVVLVDYNQFCAARTRPRWCWWTTTSSSRRSCGTTRD